MHDVQIGPTNMPAGSKRDGLPAPPPEEADALGEGTTGLLLSLPPDKRTARIYSKTRLYEKPFIEQSSAGRPYNNKQYNREEHKEEKVEPSPGNLLFLNTLGVSRCHL